MTDELHGMASGAPCRQELLVVVVGVAEIHQGCGVAADTDRSCHQASEQRGADHCFTAATAIPALFKELQARQQVHGCLTEAPVGPMPCLFDKKDQTVQFKNNNTVFLILF